MIARSVLQNADGIWQSKLLVGLGDLVGGHETCHMLAGLIILNQVETDKVDSHEISFYYRTVCFSYYLHYFRLSLDGNFTFTFNIIFLLLDHCQL